MCSHQPQENVCIRACECLCGVLGGIVGTGEGGGGSGRGRGVRKRYKE